jgi:hypothetical protein
MTDEGFRRRLRLSPDQRRREHRQELDRRMREQPEEISEEARRRGALRFFLRCFTEREPGFLADLQEILSEPLTHALQAGRLWDLSNRYHLPATADVATECVKTLLMWQAFPELLNSWHFERPEGAIADPLATIEPGGRPHPFVFVADGWNPETETLDEAKKRLRQQFNVALKDKSTFWKSAPIDQLELRLFEESPYLETLRRNLQCLAEKQVNPAISQQKLADLNGVTRDALRLGLFEAADLIQLPRERIRKARPGAPPGVKHRRRK